MFWFSDMSGHPAQCHTLMWIEPNPRHVLACTQPLGPFLPWTTRVPAAYFPTFIPSAAFVLLYLNARHAASIFLYNEMFSRSCAGNTRDRVTRACERCRLKKAKCDGKVPCSRCCADNEVCRYSLRRRQASGSASQKQKDQVLYDNESYKAGVMELYKRVISGRGLEDSVRDVEVNTNITTILDRIGVLNQDGDAGTVSGVSSTMMRSESVSPTRKRPRPPAIAPNLNKAVQSPMPPVTYLPPRPASSNQISSNRLSASATAKMITRPSSSFEPSAPPFKADNNTAHSSIYQPTSSPWSRPMSGTPISQCNMGDMATTTAWVNSDWGGTGERLPPTSMPTKNSYYHAVTPWSQALRAQEYPPQWEGSFSSSYPPLSFPPPDSALADAGGRTLSLDTRDRAGTKSLNLINDGAERPFDEGTL
ncbi:hypothetical protein PV04_07467 [Phialophora macrospora]|uniref:Zn(2)-C6 fungal-type domain-containing protein n=1 Tax=Phialophora macrospora TaxID=1851006 RepID=A0A0D2DSN6_9EURO|nr:hypothetical protein PV04_07467 [Phialophora macrospora]